MNGAEKPVRDPSLRALSGSVQREALTAYCVVHNEIFFLPAFLNHYRRLGVEQFLFVDDLSTDGSREYLSAQPDCVVLQSDVRFGDRIQGQRAVQVWRNEIPHRYFLGRWVICADADEFLEIPAGFADLPQFLNALDARAITAVAAVMVDHYPADFDGLGEARPPGTAEELKQRYPWFDRGPYIRWPEGRTRPIILHGGVRERLFQSYGISTRSFFKSRRKVIARRLRRMFGGDRNIQSIHKVPLVKWRKDLFYERSHTLNAPPAPGLLLALSHYKFTAVLNQKIEHAVSSGAYSDNSRLYHGYQQLLNRMRQSGCGFLGPQSVRLNSPKDYEISELMWCPFGPEPRTVEAKGK